MEEEGAIARGNRQVAGVRVVEQRANEGAPFIFLYRQSLTFANRKNVSGFTLMRVALSRPSG